MNIEGRIMRVSEGVWRNVFAYNCVNLTPTNYSSSVTFRCVLAQEGNYEIQCRGKDVSNNTGDWSASTAFTYDGTPPTLDITQPDFVWSKDNDTQLTWVTSDIGPTGTSYFDVYYYSTLYPGGPPAATEWVFWRRFGPPALGVTTAIFGETGAPAVLLTEGRTFYFNVTAVDLAGNTMSDVVNVTYDRTSPMIRLEKRDQNRNLILPEFIPPSAAITLINVSSLASDTLSGMKNNTIEYTVYGETYRTEQLECGPSAPQSYSWCATADLTQGRSDIPYSESTSIRYRVVSRDQAGNVNISRYYFTVSHPLANFGSGNFHLYMGDSKLIPLLVRNVQNVQDSIQVELRGYQFARFEYICEPTDCMISADERTINVYNVNPYEERVYYVRVLSSMPGSYDLNLTAISTADPSLMDSHKTTITTSYPVYFPDIGPMAILALILMAGAVFWVMSRDE